MNPQQNNLRQSFERVVVISLERRPARWQSFLSKLPADWPFGPPLRFPAVDGRTCTIPQWWQGGEGAWGCYQSHKRILEDCLAEGVESVMILEDDAVFVDGFGRRVRGFLDELPDDWSWIYLGGQHIQLHQGLPSQVSRDVYRPFNVNRTHAYAIRGRQTIERIHRHLCDTQHWTALHHIDHHLADLQQALPTGVYAPANWVVAQDAGSSDVNGKPQRRREFPGAEEICNPQVDLPMVAVVGPFSGGTSVVAGILHRLGVSMGGNFPQKDRVNWQGHFEARQLGEYCRAMFTEPWMTHRLEREHRVRLLRLWAAGHCRANRTRCKAVGGKHPAFCFLGPELVEAWNRPLIVSVERDQEETIQSLIRRDWGWPMEACMSVIPEMLAAREQFLSATTTPVLRVQFEEVLADPRRFVLRLVDRLGMRASTLQVQSAVELVTKHRTDSPAMS